MPGEKKKKKASGFKISLFYWSFSNDIMAVKGLITHATLFVGERGKKMMWNSQMRQKFKKGQHFWQ